MILCKYDFLPLRNILYIPLPIPIYTLKMCKMRIFPTKQKQYSPEKCVLYYFPRKLMGINSLPNPSWTLDIIIGGIFNQPTPQPIDPNTLCNWNGNRKTLTLRKCCPTNSHWPLSHYIAPVTVSNNGQMLNNKMTQVSDGNFILSSMYRKQYKPGKQDKFCPWPLASRFWYQ